MDLRTQRNLPRLLALSGAAALACETLWTRRLALATGSSGLAVTLVLASYMAGLGLGSAWAGRRPWRRAPGGYGRIELLAAGWALLFPALLALLSPLWSRLPGAWAAALAAPPLLLPPAFLAGATLPAASAALERPAQAGGLYAANTLGAVLGTLATAFVLLPLLGLRGSELLAAGGLAAAGLGALALSRPEAEPLPALESEPPAPGRPLPTALLLAAAAAGGLAGMALEVAWTRLAALLLGASVHALGLVLAVYLAAVAAGASWGRRAPGSALAPALAALGLLAALGTGLYPLLPKALGALYDSLGDRGYLPGGALLLALAMGGAPVASGAVFSLALHRLRARAPQRAAGLVLAANTAGGVLGSLAAGLLGLPLLGVRGTVLVAAGLAVLLAGLVLLAEGRRLAALAPAALLGLLARASPPWDAPLYAAGLYNRLDEFADLSPGAIDRFAHQGWRLLYYRDGVTATVAVGESLHSGNRWLSIDGKVDASTGRDMATQETSGWLPVRLARARGAGGRVLVVGLASGVTAGAALAEGARELWVVELEPAVVEASRYFAPWNRSVLRDPRSHLVVGDARAWLARPGPRFDAIVSEPSNPWITGVSNLFTREYWELGRSRLAERGVFCQWVQLYSLPTPALRSLLGTFLSVFPRSWLFETIPGADALLLAAPGLDELPPGLGAEPLLGPGELARFARGARPNTDDRPWIEFEAPRWLHRSTGAANHEALLRALSSGARVE